MVRLREKKTKEAMPGWGGGARPPDRFRSKGRAAKFAPKKVRHANSKGLKSSAFLHFVAGSACGEHSCSKR